MTIINTYSNGNYSVTIHDDGTKIRETTDSYFESEFPENIDIKITNQCSMGCKFCHEASSPTGYHGDIDVPFLNTLRPGTELAIGGGNPLSHPHLIQLLTRLKNNGIISNITVHQKHFIDNYKLLKRLQQEKLIYGIGVSFTSYSTELISLLNSLQNIVLHVINGIVDYEVLQRLFHMKMKLLILGYKKFRKGNDFFSEKITKNQKIIYDNIHYILHGFDVVSFDNLAIEQLNVKRLMTKDEWNEFYMGDDGKFTMYVDLVSKTYAKNSTSTNVFPIKDNIIDMFQHIKHDNI